MHREIISTLVENLRRGKSFRKLAKCIRANVFGKSRWTSFAASQCAWGPTYDNDVDVDDEKIFLETVSTVMTSLCTCLLQ